MDNTIKNIILTPFHLLYRLSPELDLKLLFRLKLGYPLDLAHPRTYNQKLQWIKLYDKNPLMPICCDKYTVRSYVEQKGYGHLLNRLLWEGFDPEDIPFDSLPEQFVIKVTHGSTFNIICTDSSKLNRRDVIRKCKIWLKQRFLLCYGEWFYGVERPRVIIEEYLEGENHQPLFDYKFFCFNGKPKLLYVDTWRQGHHAINAYDMDFQLLRGVKLGYPNDEETVVQPPAAFEEMKRIAADLSQDFLHVRVDLYCTQGKIVFGELTFTKSAGFGKIEPHSFDVQMGDWLTLPERTEEDR